MPKSYPIRNDGLRQCTHCELPKPETDEFFCRGNPKGEPVAALSRCCKLCWAIRRKAEPYFMATPEEFAQTGRRTSKAVRAAAAALRKKDPERIRRYGKTMQKREADNVKFRFSRLLCSCRVRSRQKNKPFDLTVEFLLGMYHRQSGKCALTGDVMSNIRGVGMKRMAGGIKFNISIDKIDPRGGYTKDNVQLVCFYANVMKQNLNNVELHEFCNKVLVNAGQLSWAELA